MSKVCVKKARFQACTVLFLGGFLLLCGRLFFLQVLQAGTIAEEVATVRKRLVRMEAKRGEILDRNGNLLAGTRSRILLGADPQTVDLEDRGQLGLLAGILDLPYGELIENLARRERIDSAGNRRQVRWVPLKEIDEDLYRSVQGLGIRGVYGNRRYERYYPGRELGAHLIGYINKEETPVMGVEHALDYYLRGQPGWRETEVDGRRREMAAFREREVEPRSGLDVELTLDLFVQSVVESAMKELVKATHPEGASIIVSDPRTGDILGMANYPTFDPNNFWEYPLENQRNRALTDQYEPGSTFKIVPVSAALEEGLLGPDTLIDCGKERIVFNGVDIRMPTDHRNLGQVPVRTVVAKSSNRGAATIGMMLGEDRMHDYARRFGFGERCGWPLRGEIAGNLMPVNKWDGLTISRLPTGYAIGATPIQVHQAMSAIANDGVRLRPKLLRRVIDPREEVSLPLEPERGERVISKETARMMREMLVAVVGREGTALRAELPGYAVAGKTGTSRKIIDGQYSASHHFGSFSGFFPADNPRVVITVVVDDAQVSGPAYGGVVAAPTFRNIGEKLIPHLAIRKPENWEPFLVSND
ncbi:MAG: peptidoglycan D,D-transpeptidase FtsI family protein [Opitutales bacterium]|jgi:cell division protein FtsI/penicillin-binding protein 2